MRYSYKKALERLTNHAYDEGFKRVVLNHKEISHMTTREKTLHEPLSIYIERNNTLEIKTYLFLHELGHHELRKDWKNFSKLFPVTAYAEQKMIDNGEKKYKRRNSYKVSSLEEEFIAWNEGLKLGKRLGIRINLDRWLELKSKCLKSYINYYATLRG